MDPTHNTSVICLQALHAAPPSLLRCSQQNPWATAAIGWSEHVKNWVGARAAPSALCPQRDAPPFSSAPCCSHCKGYCSLHACAKGAACQWLVSPAPLQGSAAPSPAPAAASAQLTAGSRPHPTQSPAHPALQPPSPPPQEPGVPGAGQTRGLNLCGRQRVPGSLGCCR